MSSADNPKVLIVMGSPSDTEVMREAKKVLQSLGVSCKMGVYSAHRTPERAAALAESARDNGVVAIIAGAGMAAHLAGAMAARTILPVIGVPLAASLSGLDALLATVQMPPGFPVGNRRDRKAGRPERGPLRSADRGAQRSRGRREHHRVAPRQGRRRRSRLGRTRSRRLSDRRLRRRSWRGGLGTPVFRPAPRARGSRDRALPISKKRGDGLERRPPVGIAREREIIPDDAASCSLDGCGHHP